MPIIGIAYGAANVASAAFIGNLFSCSSDLADKGSDRSEDILFSITLNIIYAIDLNLGNQSKPKDTGKLGNQSKEWGSDSREPV